MTGPVAQLDSASDYESEGYKFESCQDHLIIKQLHNCFFLIFPYAFQSGNHLPLGTYELNIIADAFPRAVSKP